MKVNIRIQNEWFVIPVPEDDQCTVGQLCSVALRRFDLMQDVDRQRFVFVSTDVGLNQETQEEQKENRQKTATSISKAVVETKEIETLNWIEIRKNNTRAVLDSNDLVSATLVDNDFLVLGKLTLHVFFTFPILNLVGFFISNCFSSPSHFESAGTRLFRVEHQSDRFAGRNSSFPNLQTGHHFFRR